MAAHTPSDSLRVQIASTCSGAWPEIVQDCVDPRTQERWVREIGRTETAFVEKSRRGTPGTYNEKPHRFKPTDECVEAVANAHLFAAAGEMLRALNRVRFQMEKWNWNSVSSTDAKREAYAEVCAAMTRATTITDMKGGD